jgi:hypothetical protein
MPLFPQPEGLIFIHISHESIPGARCAYATYGVRWQAKRDTALSWILSGGPPEPEILARPKAPSPLRSAGALHKVLAVPAHTRHLLVRVAYKD